MAEVNDAGPNRRTILLAGIAATTLFGAGLTPAQSGTDMTDEEIIKALQLAYRWGYPLLVTAINNENYAPVLNAFYLMKVAVDENSRDTPGYNAETLYCAGALDLKSEPLVLTIPKIDDRFYVFPLQDAWANAFAVVGTRTEGNNGGSYLISGPDWNGTVPQGLKHFRSHTNIAFIPGRTQVKGPEDAAEVGAHLLDKYTLTPLSRWGTGVPNPNRDSLKDPLVLDENKNYNKRLTAMKVDDYFNWLNGLLVDNPGYDEDKPVLETFAKLGVGAGLKFDLSKFSPAVRKEMEEFGRTDIPNTQRLIGTQGMAKEARPFIGRWGTDYYLRYYMIFGGLGTNLSDDAVYIWLSKDEEGAKLDGNRRYIVRFEKGKLPPAKAFWSLTLYDKNFFLAKDVPLHRHMLNNNSGMKPSADGSIEIYLQPDSPGPDKEANWLPSPRDEYFTILRLYWPEQSVLDGTWSEPAVQRAD